MTCTAHLTPADIACAATLRARFPACDGCQRPGGARCSVSRRLGWLIVASAGLRLGQEQRWQQDEE